VVLAKFPIWAALVPALLVMVAVYLLLARRIATRVQALVGLAQKELSAQPSNKREQQARIDKGIKLLEQGLVYEKWQFLVGSELRAQIGMIHYMTKNYDEAQKQLSKASSRNYMAKAFQGALYFQRKDYAQMEKSFEVAVVSGKKEAIVWAVYAWCLMQLKERDKAIRVLSRAVEKNPSDEKLKSGLTALQNDKRLKMRPYEPMWWQFGLEAPPMDMGGGGGRRIQYVRR
jgi:tetratricopeptide (TPR) repeat protein